jgi:hypothetical protein
MLQSPSALVRVCQKIEVISLSQIWWDRTDDLIVTINPTLGLPYRLLNSVQANHVPLRSENLSCDANVQMVRQHILIAAPGSETIILLLLFAVNDLRLDFFAVGTMKN